MANLERVEIVKKDKDVIAAWRLPNRVQAQQPSHLLMQSRFGGRV